MDDNNNNNHQTERGAPVPEGGSSEDKEPLVENPEEGHGRGEEGGPEGRLAETQGLPDASALEQEGASPDADGPKQMRGDREGEGEKEEEKGEETEDRNSKEQEVVKKEGTVEGAEVEEEQKDGGERDTEKEEKTEEKKMGGKRKGEEEKGKPGKGADNKTKPVKEKEKGKSKEPEKQGKSKEPEKQGKTKRKSGATPPSAPSATPLALSRPRMSARSVRASTKNDIIAKFQQGAPQTPVARNFKLQRSSVSVANGASIKQKILQWCSNKTRNYEGVSIENFSSSWCDGLAFCALVHRFFPEAFDYGSLTAKEREKNFTLAFSTAETMADCVPLLEVSDMLLMGDRPDPLCVFTYVQALCHHLSKIEKERRDRKEEEEGRRSSAEGGEKREQAAGQEGGGEGADRESPGEEGGGQGGAGEEGEEGGGQGGAGEEGKEGGGQGGTGEEGKEGKEGEEGKEGKEGEEQQKAEDCGVAVAAQA